MIQVIRWLRITQPLVNNAVFQNDCPIELLDYWESTAQVAAQETAHVTAQVAPTRILGPECRRYDCRIHRSQARRVAADATRGWECAGVIGMIAKAAAAKASAKAAIANPVISDSTEE